MGLLVGSNFFWTHRSASTFSKAPTFLLTIVIVLLCGLYDWNPNFNAHRHLGRQDLVYYGTSTLAESRVPAVNQNTMKRTPKNLVPGMTPIAALIALSREIAYLCPKSFNSMYYDILLMFDRKPLKGFDEEFKFCR